MIVKSIHGTSVQHWPICIYFNYRLVQMTVLCTVLGLHPNKPVFNFYRP